MSTLCLDTSALVKLFINETGSVEMIEICRAERGHRLAILSLTRVELRAALRRRESNGDIDSTGVDEAVERFEQLLARRVEILPVSDALIDRAIRNVDRFGLRAYDGMQLAACQSLVGSLPRGEVVFVCSDKQLSAAAIATEIATQDPSSA